MQTMTIDTARLRTHCWVAGPEDGEPLLMVHGNLVTGRFFQALAERVPDRFRVVAPDLRSFGRTAALPVDASRGMRDWSDDVRSFDFDSVSILPLAAAHWSRRCHRLAQ